MPGHGQSRASPKRAAHWVFQKPALRAARLARAFALASRCPGIHAGGSQEARGTFQAGRDPWQGARPGGGPGSQTAGPACGDGELVRDCARLLSGRRAGRTLGGSGAALQSAHSHARGRRVEPCVEGDLGVLELRQRSEGRRAAHVTQGRELPDPCALLASEAHPRLRLGDQHPPRERFGRGVRRGRYQPRHQHGRPEEHAP